MNAVEQMSPHHLQAATAAFGKSLESFRGRPDSMGSIVKIAKGLDWRSIIRLRVVPAVLGM